MQSNFTTPNLSITVVMTMNMIMTVTTSITMIVITIAISMTTLITNKINIMKNNTFPSIMSYIISIGVSSAFPEY